MNHFEIDIVKAVQSIGSRFWDGFFRVITELGNVWVALGIAILFLILFGLRGTLRYLFILGITSACGALIKIIVARDRPYIFSVDIEHTTASGYSFPSGHTLTMVVTALSIYFMISRIIRDTTTVENQRSKGLLKFLMFILLTILTLLVGFSRIYLGVHYLSDVLFAILLGVICYYIFALLYDKYIEKLIFKGARNAIPK